MNPACPKCESISTRRRTRETIGHKVMYFLGLFPWECLDCQERFYSSQRHTRKQRHPAGEVYIDTKRAPSVKPGSDEAHSK